MRFCRLYPLTNKETTGDAGGKAGRMVGVCVVQVHESSRQLLHQQISVVKWTRLILSNPSGQVCCRVLNARPPSVEDVIEDDGSPSWHLLGVLLPPFLHGLCLCSDRPRVAEGVLPSLVSFVCGLYFSVPFAVVKVTVINHEIDILVCGSDWVDPLSILYPCLQR